MRTRQQYQQFRKPAKLHKALSNERRLLLLSYLAAQEYPDLLAVTDLARELDIEYTLVSKHLLTLDQVDLIERVRHGKSVGYRVTDFGRKCLKLTA